MLTEGVLLWNSSLCMHKYSKMKKKKEKKKEKKSDILFTEALQTGYSNCNSYYLCKLGFCENKILTYY